MNSDSTTKLKWITVSGDVYLEQVPKFGRVDGSRGFVVFVLLGPTGAGKSTFIESLAPHTTPGLSSNGLEGFTQSISIYRVVNVRYNQNYPIYMVDVPGFADSKISVLSIVSMLKNMIQTNRNPSFYLLYFTPIDTPRLSGNKREVVRTFEALTGLKSATKIVIVSTMWDSLGSENAKIRAENNFSELRNRIWKDYIAAGADIVKFGNTQNSALIILDNAIPRPWNVEFYLERSISQPLQDTRFAPHIYNDLETRIQDLKVQRSNIRSELKAATKKSDEQLKAILVPQLEETQTLLDKFKKELRDFGSPADSPHSPQPAHRHPTPTIQPKKGFFAGVIGLVKYLGKKLRRNRYD